MKKTEEWLKELPAPLNDWALSQVDKGTVFWLEEVKRLEDAINVFSNWKNIREGGGEFWNDVYERAANNTLHEHPDKETSKYKL